MRRNILKEKNMPKASNKKFKKALRLLLEKISEDLKEQINIRCNDEYKRVCARSIAELFDMIQHLIIKWIEEIEHLKVEFPQQYRQWYDVKCTEMPIMSIQKFLAKINPNENIDLTEYFYVQLHTYVNNLFFVTNGKFLREFTPIISWLDVRAMVCYYIEKNRVTVDKFNQTLENLFKRQRQTLIRILSDNESCNQVSYQFKDCSSSSRIADVYIRGFVVELFNLCNNDDYNFQSSKRNFKLLFYRWFCDQDAEIQQFRNQDKRIFPSLNESVQQITHLDVCNLVLCRARTPEYAYLLRPIESQYYSHIWKNNLSTVTNVKHVNIQKVLDCDDLKKHVYRFLRGG